MFFGDLELVASSRKRIWKI